MSTPHFSASDSAIVIGASAGAVEALSILLPHLPAKMAAAVFIVVHLPPDRKSILAELFQERCAVTIKEAEDKEPIERGTVYFAPPDYHLLVETNHSLSLSSEEPILFSRPSIDVLFESAADVYGENLTAIILTGANPDGAAGVKAVSEAGGKIVIQKPGEAYARAMPEAALKACPDAMVFSLEEIVNYLKSNI